MSHSTTVVRPVQTLVSALAFMTFLSLVPLDSAQAKRGRDNDNRAEFHGIVQSRPENVLPGVWVIGGRTFKADSGTEFNQREGELLVGSCAKVQIRDGRVHEIDSEPKRNCR